MIDITRQRRNDAYKTRDIDIQAGPAVVSLPLVLQSAVWAQGLVELATPSPRYTVQKRMLTVPIVIVSDSITENEGKILHWPHPMPN